MDRCRRRVASCDVALAEVVMGLDITLLGNMKPCDRCMPCHDCDGKREYREEAWSGNITHNLVEMAVHADLYKPLWYPDELGFTKASQLVPLLEAGLKKLEAEPDFFKKFNPKNGWGSYDGFLSFVTRYLESCRENPEAEVSVWR